MFSVLQVSREHVDRSPATGTHDGRRIETFGQQVLSRADAHRMSAEGIHVRRVETNTSGRILDEPLDRGRAEIAVHGHTLVDGAEEPLDPRAAPIQLVADQLRRSP